MVETRAARTSREEDPKAGHPGVPLPVTLLSGFLGAGKTTLLQHILKNKEGLRCAVIVNDMAELNIDASLVKQGGLIQTQERLVEMQNGCICCTLRDDLLQEVSQLAREGRFDYLVIESTGISEPQQVAETFELPPSEGASPLKELARLDTCVTVVDATNLLLNMASIETVADREGPEAAGGERNVADLLLDQIEFADVILLNKTDLVEEAERLTLAAFLRRLNPGARILPTTQARVDLSEVVGTGRFDIDKAAEAAGWLQSLKEAHTPETEEYGIASFVYRARRPFHPDRLWQMLRRYWAVQQVESLEEEEEEDGEEGQETGEGGKGQQKEGEASEGEAGPVAAIVSEPVSAEEAQARQAQLHRKFGQVLRSKGFLWLAGRDEMSGEWSQAGAVIRISPSSPWFAAIPEELWPDVDPAKVRADFAPEVGDRRQELVFIGIGLKKEALSAALDACLVTEEEAEQELACTGFVQWPGVEIEEVTDSDSDSEGGPEESEDSSSGAEEDENLKAAEGQEAERGEEAPVLGKRRRDQRRQLGRQGRQAAKRRSGPAPGPPRRSGRLTPSRAA